MNKANDKAKEAYSRFDTSEHEVLGLLRAILHTAAGGLDPDDAHQAADEGAFEIIYSLAHMAEKLLKRDLHPAVVDLRDAMEPHETRAPHASCRLHCVKESSIGNGVSHG